MKKQILILFSVAIGIALVVSTLVKSSVSSEDVEMTEIMVSTKEQPAGSFFDERSFTWQSWPYEGLPFGTVTRKDFDEFEGDFLENARLRRGLVRGEPIMKSAIVRPNEQGFLAAVLEEGKRAVSIPVKAETSVAGFVRPGDWVDVVLTYEVRLGSGVNKSLAAEVVSKYAAETVIEGVRVLAVDQDVNDQKLDASPGKTVTLEVTPEQSERVALAERMGDLSLSLRGMSKENDKRKNNYTADIEIGRALNAARKASESGEVQKTVRLYHGASATVVEVVGE